MTAEAVEQKRLLREARMVERLSGGERARYMGLVEERRIRRVEYDRADKPEQPRTWPLPVDEHAAWVARSDASTAAFCRMMDAQSAVEEFEQAYYVEHAPSCYRVGLEAGLMELGHEFLSGGLDAHMADRIDEMRRQHGQVAVLRWMYANAVLGKWSDVQSAGLELATEALETGSSNGFNALVGYSGRSGGEMYERDLERRLAFLDNYRQVVANELARVRGGSDEPFDGAFADD